MKELLDHLVGNHCAKIQYYEGGRIVERSFAQLAKDIERRAGELRALGLGARNKVGLLADNSYQWIVHDLALISIDAISFCFPKDTYDSSFGVQICTEAARNQLINKGSRPHGRL